MKSLLSRVISSLVLALALQPLLARSQTVTLMQTSIESTAYTVTVDAGSAPSVSGYSTTQSYSTTNQDPSSLGLPDTLNLFCVELGQDASTSPLSYGIVSIAQADMGRTTNSIDADAGVPISGIGTDAGLKLEKLYGFVFPTYNNSSALNVDLSAAGISGSAAYDSAVFQLAVWQVAETDSFGNISLTGPGFFASSATPTLLSDANQLPGGRGERSRRNAPEPGRLEQQHQPGLHPPRPKRQFYGHSRTLLFCRCDGRHIPRCSIT